VAFALLAVFQVSWSALILCHSRRWLADGRAQHQAARNKAGGLI